MTGQEVREDASHDGRFGFVDDHMGRAVRSARDAAVAVGDLGGQHLARAGPIQLASPSPLRKFGPFVLGDHPLDLDQQPSLGIVEGWGVSETDRHVEAGEFLEDEDLVRVRPGQAIWRKTPDDVDDAGFGRVAQGIQPGAVQARSGVSVIDELTDQFVALGGDPGPQRVELRTDRSPGFLGVGRHSGVDPYFHGFLLRAELAHLQPPETIKSSSGDSLCRASSTSR